MNARNLTLLLASSSSAASVGFILGRQTKDECNFGALTAGGWKQLLPLRTANAETTAGTLVLPPQVPTIPAGPVELKQPVKTHGTDLPPWEKSSRASEIMRFGYPGFDNLRTFEDFILSYDRRNRTAHWVMEHLSPDRLEYHPEVDRSKCIFRPDPSIHPYFQSQNEDYRRSGFDRGHLASAGNHRRSQLAIDQTFLLSNMSPQVGKGFNRDKWNDLEKHMRRLARKHLNVYICTGPLYLPYQETDGHFYVKYKVIGNSRVAVPTHFFKVALIEAAKDHFELEAYLLPNAAIPDEKPLSDFLVPLDAIERAAGFLLFEKLPKEQLKKINGKSIGGGSGGILRLFG